MGGMAAVWVYDLVIKKDIAANASVTVASGLPGTEGENIKLLLRDLINGADMRVRVTRGGEMVTHYSREVRSGSTLFGLALYPAA